MQLVGCDVKHYSKHGFRFEGGCDPRHRPPMRGRLL